MSDPTPAKVDIASIVEGKSVPINAAILARVYNEEDLTDEDMEALKQALINAGVDPDDLD